MRRIAAIGLLLVTIAATVSIACLEGNFPTQCSSESATCIDSGADFGSDALGDIAGDAGSDTTDAGLDAGLSQLAVVETACARLTACNQGAGAIDFSSCVHGHLRAQADVSGHPLRPAAWGCIDAATNCAAIDACLGGASAPAACTGKGSAVVCIGSNAVRCSGSINVGAFVCALNGEGCSVLSATDATCAGTGICSTSAPATCASPTKLVQCTGTTDNGSDCAALGGICAGSDAGVTCTGDDAPCTTTGTSCKDSTTAILCRGGRTRQYDCGVLLSSCAAVALDSGDDLRGCAPTATECKDSDPPSCDGDNIRHCVGGHSRLVRCADLGLGPCASLTTVYGPSVACGRK